MSGEIVSRAERESMLRDPVVTGFGRSLGGNVGWVVSPRIGYDPIDRPRIASGPSPADFIPTAQGSTRSAPGRFSVRKRRKRKKGDLDYAKIFRTWRDRTFRKFLSEPIPKPDRKFYSDPILEEARVKALNQAEPILNLLALRGSRADVRLRARPRTPGSSFPSLQKGFVAPKGVRPPPAAPGKAQKAPGPVWEPPRPPKPPPRKPPPARTAPPPLPRPPGKVRKVPVRPWEGAARVPSSWKTGRELEKAVGIQTRVKVGKGLEVLLPPQAKLDVVSKAQKALDKVRERLGKLDIFKPRAPFKLKPARPFSPAKALPTPPPLRDLQRVLDLVRPRRGVLELPPGVKEPGDSLLDPVRPGLGNRNLTQPQEQGLRSRSKSCECPDTKPKKKRLSCRQGYFRETARGITYTTWSKRKCPV